jgi:predicted metalloprotease with PDZ domain
MTGSGIYNGFMIQSTNNVFNSWSSMNYIFYHEMMHDWIGGKLRVRYEELNYWFSEGFTDYYTFKGRLRSGSLSREEWLSEFNREVWKAHYLNPERNQPNYIIKDAFWENRNIEKIPYRRGALFAFWLDQQLLIQSNGQFSLDDLMRELLSECEVNHTEVTDDLFLSYAERHLDRKIAYFFQKHVIAGVDINWDEFPLQQGIQVTKDTNGIPQLTITGNTTDVFRFYLQE